MKIISAVLLMLLFFPALYFHPVSVFAQTNTPKYEVLTFSAAEGIPSLIKIIIGWAFKFAGVFAFAMIVFAGFEYTTSGGNTSKQKDAQERIVSVIVGIILLFAFYIILYTINPDILKSPSETAAPTPPAVTPPAVTPPDQGLSGTLVDIIKMGLPVDSGTLGTLAQGSEAYLDKTLADTLLALKDKTPAWVVTDACIDPKCQSTSEPDRPSDDCHLDGTCVDIDAVSGNYNDNIKLIKIFNEAGLNVLDEGDHLHIASPEASGYGSYQNSGCEGKTSPCSFILNGKKVYWYGAT